MRRHGLRATVVAGLLALAATTVPSAGASTGVWQHYAFDGCTWMSYADNGIGLSDILGAETRTVDVNGGCRNLKAWVRYYTSPSTTSTKYCGPSTAAQVNCVIYGYPHHTSNSSAESWETYRWQTSGWWG